MSTGCPYQTQDDQDGPRDDHEGARAEGLYDEEYRPDDYQGYRHGERIHATVSTSM